MTCHCGLSEKYETCCGSIIDGTRFPSTAEELMRARYSAHVVGAIDYIVDTHDPKKRGDVKRANIEEWSKESDWLGLEIVAKRYGGASDHKGNVEFIARFKRDGKEQEHREFSNLRRIDNRWCYVDGRVRMADPEVRAEKKIGRNDACPCGSGKKYKKCCGA